jgi:peptidoglycan hydrolase-like protein with peptidoglycan-binding domain
MRPSRWMGAAAAGVVLAGGAWVVTSGADDSQPARAAENFSTAEVERRDLVERETFDGTLGYADQDTLTAGIPGTLTAIRREGAVVRRGGTLYRVDDTDVRLLYGQTPAWRPFADGMSDGPDVEQLERNLVALGNDPDDDIEVDKEFDWATEAAIRRWEDALGVAEDGTIALGEVVFASGLTRAGQHHLEPGAAVAPGAQVLDVSSTEQVVTVQLEADRQDLVSRGDRVTVEMPDGSVMRGTITEVGRVAQTDPEDEEADPFIEVTLSLGQAAGRALDQAPVDVGIQVERARDVLAVPVYALLALAEGGYALEVISEGGGTQLVGIETGLVADGWVEVSGSGIDEGTRVVVPE